MRRWFTASRTGRSISSSDGSSSSVAGGPICTLIRYSRPCQPSAANVAKRSNHRLRHSTQDLNGSEAVADPHRRVGWHELHERSRRPPLEHRGAWVLFYSACVFVRHCFSSAMTAHTAQLDDEISVYRADSTTRGVPLWHFEKLRFCSIMQSSSLRMRCTHGLRSITCGRGVSHINGRVGLSPSRASSTSSTTSTAGRPMSGANGNGKGRIGLLAWSAEDQKTASYQRVGLQLTGGLQVARSHLLRRERWLMLRPLTL